MMKNKIRKSFRRFILEMLDIKNIFKSLSLSEKAEFGKIIAFGLFVNSGYGLLHGNFYDLPVVFVTLYAIMKLIKVERSDND
jgi:hypothetical protein